MTADPRKVRYLLAGLILFVGIAIQLTSSNDVAEPEEPGEVIPADIPAAEPERQVATDDGPPADEARALAAEFTAAYLTWSPDETAHDRAVRVGRYTTGRFARDLAQVRTDDVFDQETDVLEVQDTTSSRFRHEVVVMVEIDAEGADPVRTSLGVAMVDQDGAWVVESVR